MNLQEAVLHDRQVRRKLSRRKYADLVGIPEGRVHAIENEKRPRRSEAEALHPYIGDIFDFQSIPADGWLGEGGGGKPASKPKPAKTEDPSPTPGPTPPDDAAAQRTLLVQEYVKVINQLNGRIPPYPWPSQFRMETVPPVEFGTIWSWLRDVQFWLAEEDGTPAPNLVHPRPEPEPEPEDVYDEEESGDWETTAEVTAEDGPHVTEAGTTLTNGDAQDLADEPDDPEEIVLQDEDADLERFKFPFDPAIKYVTNGELQTFKDCRRRWYLQTYLRRGRQEEKVTGAAATGTRYHAALAAWYQPEPGDPWDTFNRKVHEEEQVLIAQDANEETFKDWESEVDLVRAMLEGYFEWVQETGADAGLKITAAEHVIVADPKFPEFPHVRLLAKLDATADQEMDGSRVFIDHKTVQSLTEAIKTLQLDEQMQHYNLVRYLQLVEEGLQNELRVGGAIYNMARKVKRTAQANPPFYGREPVQFNNAQLQSYWLRVLGTVREILRVTDQLNKGGDHREIVPPRPSRECHWKCEFWQVCPMMDHTPAGASDYLNEVYVEINPLRRYEPDAIGVTM